MLLTCNLVHPSHSDQSPYGPHWQCTLWPQILAKEIKTEQNKWYQNEDFTMSFLQCYSVWCWSKAKTQIYPLGVKRNRSDGKTARQSCAIFWEVKRKREEKTGEDNLSYSEYQTFWLNLKHFVKEFSIFSCKSTCLHAEQRGSKQSFEEAMVDAGYLSFVLEMGNQTFRGTLQICVCVLGRAVRDFMWVSHCVMCVF